MKSKRDKNSSNKKKRKSALLKLTAATGTFIGTTMMGPGNTVYAQEMDSASTDS